MTWASAHIPRLRWPRPEKASAARRAAAAGDDPISLRRARRAKVSVPTFREIAAEVIALEQAASPTRSALPVGPPARSSLLQRQFWRSPLAQSPPLTLNASYARVWTTKPETARKLHRRLRRVFEHARIRLRDAHGISLLSNPARWDDLKALGFAAPEKLSRGPQPSLAYPQLPGFMAELRRRKTMSARALELLILTAVRTDAVRRAEWKEFDLRAALWTVPVDHLKARGEVGALPRPSYLRPRLSS